MKSTVLLADSDFFIALYKRDDANHERAIELLEKIQQEGQSLALSVLAYSEITTVLSQRVGKKVAHDFIQDRTDSGVRLIHTTAPLVSRANRIFSGQRSKNLSFTDAFNIALVFANSLSSIVSFDSDYPKNNVVLFE